MLVSKCAPMALTGALLAEADEGLGPASRLGVMVGADTVGTFRITVAGQPAISPVDHKASTSSCAIPTRTNEPSIIRCSWGRNELYRLETMRRQTGCRRVAARRGASFPSGVVLSIGVVVAVNAGMIYAALHTFPGAGR